jgi:thiamine-monophosphate kinase
MSGPSASGALLELVVENRAINDWLSVFERCPHRLNAPHCSDAELLAIPGCERLLACSTDGICEEILVGLYREPFTVGWAAVMANFSDLAAVGAEPVGLLLSVVWPNGTPDEFKQEVARGVHAACVALKTYLVGGDTGAGPTLSLTGCALGWVDRSACMTRVGMTPGDVVYLSHRAGLGNLMASRLLLGPEAGGVSEGVYRPMARIREGQIAGGCASACMDTSDGVFSTLDQLVRLNRVGIRIEAEWRDLVIESARVLPSWIPRTALLAGYHGEYELVFTVPADMNSRFLACAAAADWHPVRLGTAVETVEVFHRERSIDMLFYRNLLDSVQGDIEAYARGLLDACKSLEV